MTEEKLVIPDDLKARLKKLAEASKTKPAAIMERLREILDTDEKIQVMKKPEFKIRYAVALLLKERVSTGRTTDFYFKPALHFNYREIKSDSKYVGDLAGMVKKIETDEDGNLVEGEVEYGAGTVWRDGAKQLIKLDPNKVYKGSFIAEKNSWGWELGGNNPGFTEVDGIEFPEFKDFYEKEIAPQGRDVVLADMDMDQSQNSTDVKVLNVTILDGDIKERPDHSEYGYYDIHDDSFISTEKGVQGQRIFIDPRDVKLETGCFIKVGTKIEVRNEKIQLSPQFIIPVGDVQEKIFAPKTESTGQESVNAEDLTPPSEGDSDDDFGTL